MSATVTPTTASALRKVFAMLEDNFDPEKGCYLHGFDDEKIAKDTGISSQAVKEYRVKAFGKLKPPTEFDSFARELAELEALYLRTEQQMKDGLKDLKARMSNMQRKFD